MKSSVLIKPSHGGIDFDLVVRGSKNEVFRLAACLFEAVDVIGEVVLSVVFSSSHIG